MHPDVDHLGFLVGSWHGSGHGDYPTIDPFDYSEHIVFEAPQKPFLVYRQSTHSTTGDPLHTETGYLRPAGNGHVELVIAQPTGIVEVHTGTVEGTTLHFRTVEVTGTPSAKEVTSVERIIEVAGDTLGYELYMAAVGQPHLLHLAAHLTRQTV